MSRSHTAIASVTAVIGSLAASAVLSMSAQAATVRDSDGDGMPNRWEVAHGLNAHKANARADKDKDGLRNLGEYKHDTDPADEDSFRQVV